MPVFSAASTQDIPDVAGQHQNDPAEKTAM
jgi:hypothetical protein